MDSVVLFYSNALIYSPNEFFIFLLVLLVFITLVTGNAFYLFIKSISYAAEYIIDVQKRRKNTRHYKFKSLLKIILAVYFVLGKKISRIIFYTRKMLNVIKEEVLIKEGE